MEELWNGSACGETHDHEQTEWDPGAAGWKNNIECKRLLMSMKHMIVKYTSARCFQAIVYTTRLRQKTESLWILLYPVELQIS